uniref:H-NS histone family protein n=1 Tax=Candidatus Kentrum sp. FW TaxID=2126338 RepID=A0A450TKR5_9GAMM|nr:MAG: H-NS histone family protein [Candidatus Kentron sp. FW]
MTKGLPYRRNTRIRTIRKKWSGRGRKPGWVDALIEQGKSLEDFRIEDISQ